MFAFLIIGLLAGGLVMVFALQNIVTISVTFLAWQIQAPLALIVVLSIAIGIIIGTLLSLSGILKRSSMISRLKKRGMALSEELDRKDNELDQKEIEVQEEKNKLAATNAYIDEELRK